MHAFADDEGAGGGGELGEFAQGFADVSGVTGLQFDTDKVGPESARIPIFNESFQMFVADSLAKAAAGESAEMRGRAMPNHLSEGSEPTA